LLIAGAKIGKDFNTTNLPTIKYNISSKLFELLKK